MRYLAALLLSLAATASSAQTYNITGTLKGFGGEDYNVSGTATLDNGTWVINGDLTSTTPPRPPPQQCQTINAPNGSLTDPGGAVWSWGGPSASGVNRRVLRNGVEQTVGVAISLANGNIFVRGAQGLWFQAPDWQQQAGPPPGC